MAPIARSRPTRTPGDRRIGSMLRPCPDPPAGRPVDSARDDRSARGRHHRPPPGDPAAHRRDRPRGVPPRRDGLSPGRTPAGHRLPDHHGGSRGPRPDRCRTPGPGRPPRRRDGPVGWRRRHRGRPDDGLHRDGQDPRDRPREPGRGRPAGRHQRPSQGRRRRRGPVLPARPRKLRDVLDRWQPGHQRRRPVLRQVRPDARVGPLARGRDGRRHGNPDWWPERQGRGRVLADAPLHRQPGDPRDHDRGDPPAPTRAAAPIHDARLLPDDRQRRRRRRRDRGRGA